MKKFSIIAVLATFAFACEKEIDMDIPNNGTNLVVNALVKPDVPWRVHVSGSLHILDNGEPPNIGDAVVIVTDGNGNSETLAHSSDGFYDGIGSPVAGQSYRINVSSPIYDNVQGETSIPAAVPIEFVDTTHQVSFEDFELTEVKLRFTDPGGVKNYYYLKVQTGEDNGNGLDLSNTGFYSREGIIDQSPGGNNHHYRGVTFSDELYDGQTYDFVIYMDGWYFEDWGQGQSKVVFSLYSTSKEYYEYLRTYMAYEDTNGDPFAQPVIIFSNIEGGHGVFGGYTTSGDTLDL